MKGLRESVKGTESPWCAPPWAHGIQGASEVVLMHKTYQQDEILPRDHQFFFKCAVPRSDVFSLIGSV